MSLLDSAISPSATSTGSSVLYVDTADRIVIRLQTILLLVLFVLGLAILALDIVLVSAYPSSFEWGFGQLLPTFLILLPFYTLTEEYVGTCDIIHYSLTH